jgi:septum site-determining protein MinC
LIKKYFNSELTGPVVTSAPQPFEVYNRKLMTSVLVPEAPIEDWLTRLDDWTRSSPNFFAGKPVVLDLTGVTISEWAAIDLIPKLSKRGIRIMAIEGVDPCKIGPQLPPVLQRNCSMTENRGPNGSSHPDPAKRQPRSLLLEAPVRSGQTVIFPDGDVTVLGPVASGAELVAGGSIHVYGTLRGRAMAGSSGHAQARIFCARNEAELLAINGYYRVAEDMEAVLRSRPTQAWLNDDCLMISPLD